MDNKRLLEIEERLNAAVRIGMPRSMTDDMRDVIAEVRRLKGAMFELWEEHSHGVLYEDFMHDYYGYRNPPITDEPTAPPSAR